MRNLILIFTSGLIVLLLLPSCGGGAGSDCDENLVSQSFLNAAERVTATISNLDASSSEYCDEFKDAYIDYIDELEDFLDCADEFGFGSEWRQSIQEVRDDIINDPC